MNNIIDAKGLKCPEPIMMLHKAIRESKQKRDKNIIEA